MEVNCFWTRLFGQHFLFTTDEYRDDMLFFVYRRTATNRAEMQVIIIHFNAPFIYNLQ